MILERIDARYPRFPPDFLLIVLSTALIVAGGRRAYTLHTITGNRTRFQKTKGRNAMRCPNKEFLWMTALLCGLALAGSAQAPTAPTKTLRPVSNFVPVTDQMMRAPKPQDWLIHRGNYQAWGYSPLDQINKTNIKNLQLVWSRNMEPGSNEATALVYNGVMYLGNPGDVIQAIDAATGDLMWEYRHPLPPAG
jgi:glucose dehydrogenase